jgi:hypothetical protein
MVKNRPFVSVLRARRARRQGTNAGSPASDVPRFGQVQRHRFRGRVAADVTPSGSTGAPSSLRGGVWQARGMLDDASRRTLDLEASWWRYAGTKEAAIRRLFAEDPPTYYRRLGRLIDDPAAMEHAPVLVRRLRRQRARRIGSRSGRRLAG